MLAAAITATIAMGLWAAATERGGAVTVALIALSWLGSAALVAELLPLM